MQRDTAVVRPATLGFLASALVTLVALYLVWAALVDISHHEADLTAEHAALVIGVGWFVALAVILVSIRHRLLGALSLLAVGAGIWGWNMARSGGTARLSGPAIAIASAFLWFLALAVMLGFLSWRASGHDSRTAS